MEFCNSENQHCGQLDNGDGGENFFVCNHHGVTLGVYVEDGFNHAVPIQNCDYLKLAEAKSEIKQLKKQIEDNATKKPVAKDLFQKRIVEILSEYATFFKCIDIDSDQYKKIIKHIFAEFNWFTNNYWATVNNSDKEYFIHERKLFEFNVYSDGKHAYTIFTYADESLK